MRPRTNNHDGTLDVEFTLAYQRLIARARALLGGDRGRLALTPTVLVHETYERLARERTRRWNTQSHLLAFATIVMRQIIIDDYRHYGCKRRGGDCTHVTLDADGGPVSTPPESVDSIALRQVMQRLEGQGRRIARVATLRGLQGHSIGETAAELGTSRRTVVRDWEKARAWLECELRD